MSAFARLHTLAHESALLHSTASILGWDQETYMPPAATQHRAAQLSYLSTKAHELETSSAWKQALEAAVAEDDQADARKTATLVEMQRRLVRSEALPTELVARSSQASSLAKPAWAAAR